jgi:hypothetical protein
MSFIPSDRNVSHPLTNAAKEFRKYMCRRRYLIFRGLGRFFIVFHPFFSRKWFILSMLMKTPGYERRIVMVRRGFKLDIEIGNEGLGHNLGCN